MRSVFVKLGMFTLAAAIVIMGYAVGKAAFGDPVKAQASAPSVESSASVSAPAESSTPCPHHKFLYRVARDRAVAQYAREKGITREAAREKADRIDDSTVHAAVKAAGIQFQDLPPSSGPSLDAVLKWIMAHQDQIVAVMKIFLTLLAVLG